MFLGRNVCGKLISKPKELLAIFLMKFEPLPKKSVLDWELVLRQRENREDGKERGANQDLVSEGCLHGFKAVATVLMSQLVLKNKVLMSLNLLCSHLL